MLHQLVVSVCFQNKILLYVCIRMYCRVTLCDLKHDYYLKDMWLLFYCITACCNLLSLINFHPLFCNRKFYVDRNKGNITINVQSTTTGKKLRLKTTIRAPLLSLER